MERRALTRVLVTGASGFVGRQVVTALLTRGCEVHTAGRRSCGRPDVSHHPADLLAADAAAALLSASRPDIVVHCAWFVEHGRFWNAPENLDWLAATLHLARAAAAGDVGRFVGMGTCMEYDWTHEPGRARREDDPLAATSLYAETKLATFRVLGRLLADGNGTAFAWARLFHPFGDGEPGQKLVPSLVRSLARREPMTVRSGSLVRDFIAVEDAAEAIVALALSSATGAVNIATGQAVPVRLVVDSVRAAFGGDPTTFEDAPAGSEPAVMAADVSRLRHEVGHPAPPAMAERLAAYARALAGTDQTAG